MTVAWGAGVVVTGSSSTLMIVTTLPLELDEPGTTTSSSEPEELEELDEVGVVTPCVTWGTGGSIVVDVSMTLTFDGVGVAATSTALPSAPDVTGGGDDETTSRCVYALL